MNGRVFLPVFLLLSALAFTAIGAEEPKEAGKKSEKHPDLERFKELAGDWVGKEKAEEKEFTVNYKVTSAGTAVVETIMPGSDHEMVTIIHQDGKDLALTHYCALGNQPHMKTEGKSDGKMVEFKFSSASYMKSEKEMHMHNVTFTFVDKDTLKAEWTHYNDGKDAGKVTFDLKRKK